MTATVPTSTLTEAAKHDLRKTCLELAIRQLEGRGDAKITVRVARYFETYFVTGQEPTE